MTDSTRHLGQRGELLAAAHLRARGYAIVDVNWRCTRGELDIVARDGDTLVFVEVRARHTVTTDAAFESIGPRKRSRLISAAYAYLAAHKLDDCAWRVDVIAVAQPPGRAPILEHVENALDW